MAITAEDVKHALKYFIDGSISTEVDDEGYVCLKNSADDTFTRVELGDKKSPVILYQERIVDATAAILNPFSEGLTPTPQSNLFYRILRSAAVKIGRAS